MAAKRQLSDLVSIGPAMLKDFAVLGIRSVADLKTKNADRLYEALCKKTGHRHDPCVIDVFNAAIAQAKDPRLPKEKCQWWYWSRLRKMMILVFGVGWAMTPTNGFANDSLAEVRAGGLVLQRSRDIRMVAEDLYLSLRTVRVTSTFVNDAPNAITTTVAFPVPDIPANPEGDIHIDLTNENPLAFAITVNGRPHPVQIEKKTVEDVIQLRYYWEQTFPPKTPVVIRHEYKPAWGQFSLYIATGARSRPLFELSERAEYCMDAGFLQAANALTTEAAARERYPQVYTMGYVLVSGANWKGPIGDFHLTIEKPKAADLVSLCGSGIKKTGPTTFEVRQTDFRPTKDIRLLFLTEGHLE